MLQLVSTKPNRLLIHNGTEQYDSRDKSVKQYKKIAVKVKEKS